MIPFRLTSASRAANSSPSVTLEKGAYRMRAPLTRSSGEPFHTRSPVRHQRVDSSTNPNLAVLVLLLTVASFACFGTAYYLFVTRWEARALSQHRHADQQAQAISVKFHHQSTSLLKDHPHELFLTYLPHSGFHNQRIAFENALVIARLLNRTLLAPPIRLGNKPLRYLHFDALYKLLVSSDKHGLFHCSKVPSHIGLPLECAGYFDYTQIAWDWLVNLSEVESHQRLVQRWDMSDAWIHKQLGISETDVLTLKDDTPYHFRFLDTLTDASPPAHKYEESIYLSNLASSTKRLIQIGTLFGSSRLRLKSPENIAIRGTIRQSMSYSNPALIHIADSIAKSMAGPYLGAHVRLGDGHFQANMEANARIIWWRLVHHVLEYTAEETLDLERTFGISLGSHLTVPEIPLDHQFSMLNISLRFKQSFTHFSCRGRPHTHSRLRPLNVPLFISTDVKQPAINPVLTSFQKTFPCSFYLSDFSSNIARLNYLQNVDDGVMLGEFLLPFLDAMVLGRAWQVVGTGKSTFSTFVQDVLWRTYHGKAIVQRG